MKNSANSFNPERALRKKEAIGLRNSIPRELDGGLTPARINIRWMNVDDAGFVLDSWCGSYSSSPVVGPIDRDLFKIEQRNRVYRLIPKCRVLVACNPDDEKSIRGWAAAEPPKEQNGLWILHYVLTRYELQGQGIASALVANFRNKSPGREMWASHWTPALKWYGTIDKNKDNRWLHYNSYVLEV